MLLFIAPRFQEPEMTLEWLAAGTILEPASWLEIDDGPHHMSSAKLTLHHPQIVDVYYT